MKRSKPKQRRIIYNDDGDSRWLCGEPTREEFLAHRFNWCKDSHVDTIFWCLGNGEDPPYNRPTSSTLGDANALMLEAARDADIEIFATLRMNDSHDSFMPELLPPLKLERPDLLVAPKRDYTPDTLMELQWSAFDYSHPEVREHFLNFIKDTLSRYDWDGLELDFCRHVLHFKWGEAHKHLDTMTAFVGQVRAMTDDVAKRRGRPCPLCVRVVDTPELCLRTGIDIETWMARGYIDILAVGGGYRAYAGHFWELITLARRFDVQVYPAIDAAITPPVHTGDEFANERLRAMAANLWSLGADGIYLFNLFMDVDIGELEVAKAYSVLHELGDPDVLMNLEKIYQVQAPPAQLPVHYTSPPYPLPVRVLDCVPLTLRIADPVERAVQHGRLEDLLLRIRITDLLDEEDINVSLNDQPVEIRRTGPEKLEEIPWGKGGGMWFAASVTAPPLRRGENTVRVWPGNACWGRDSTEVHDVQLVMRHKQGAGS